jgi:hypothetical protein
VPAHRISHRFNDYLNILALHLHPPFQFKWWPADVEGAEAIDAATADFTPEVPGDINFLIVEVPIRLVLSLQLKRPRGNRQ